MVDPKPSPSLRYNIISNLIGQVVLMVLSLVSTRFIFRELGADVLGIIYFSVTVTFFLISLSDMGFSPMATREIAAHRHSDKLYISELIGTLTTLSWTAYVISCLIIIVLAPVLVSRWLQIESIDLNKSVFAFLLISCSLLLSIPRAIYGAIIAGNERMDVWNTINVSAVGLQQLGMILLLGLGGTLHDVAVWYVVSGIASIVLFICMASHLSGISPFRLTYNWSVIQRNFHFSSNLFAISFVGYLAGQVDKWVVSKLLPASVFGYYSVLQGLVSKGSMVPSAIATAAFPSLSARTENNEKTDWMMQYRKLQEFCGFIYVPVTAAMAMLGFIILSYVLNEEIAMNLWPALILLAIGQLFLGLQNVPYIMSLAMRRPEISLRANLLALPINISAVILLTIYAGITGAAFSFIIAGLLGLLLFIPKFSSECLKTGSWYWFRNSILLTVLGFFSYGLPWFAVWKIGLGFDTFGLITAYTIGSVIFFVSGWGVIGSELKIIIRKQLRTLGIKVAA